MRTVLMVALAALTATWTPCLAQQAGLFDELAVFYPDSDASAGVERFAGDSPRGVPAGVDVLISGLPKEASVSWKLMLAGAVADNARAFRMIDVPVEQNTGLGSRTEASDGKTNPYVIRRAPFRVFEALEPIADSTTASDAGVLALRVEVPIGADDRARLRSYELTLESGDWKRVLQWDLTVHDATVPPTGPQSPGYTNWFSNGIIAQRHGLEPWSEPFWRMLGKYADLMARGRQNTFWVPWGDFAKVASEGTVELDSARFKRYVKLFLDRGFTRIEGGHLANRHQGDWNSPRLDFVLTGDDVSSERGQAEVARLLSEARAALDELDSPAHVEYLQHLTDEPTDANAASYQALAELVRREMPGVKIFDATMSLKLVGAVDQWCPQVQEYQRHRDFFDARKADGNAVWVYTCLSPGGRWLNRLLDQERLRPVYLGWALVKYDLAGFLHWGLNHYRPGVDPFEQSVVSHGGGKSNFLPAGDSHIIYPGKDGPLSGQRFEAQRIGMEDAELLRLLKARDPDRATAIINRVLRAFDDYDTDIAAYRAARRDLLVAMSEPPSANDAVMLFNGKNLDGWTACLPDGVRMEDVWSVADGVLICKGTPTGYIRTKQEYTNYRLSLEWRWSPETKQAGNSGVLLRVIGEDKVWPRCIEAQLQSGNAGDFLNIGEFAMKTDPERTKGRNTKKMVVAENPVGEWNRYDITVDGPTITLEINGNLVNKAWDVQVTPGKIALQSEGAEVHFRNVRLTSLD